MGNRTSKTPSPSRAASLFDLMPYYMKYLHQPEVAIDEDGQTVNSEILTDEDYRIRSIDSVIEMNWIPEVVPLPKGICETYDYPKKSSSKGKSKQNLVIKFLVLVILCLLAYIVAKASGITINFEYKGTAYVT